MKQFTPKKVIIYGKDGDRVEIELTHHCMTVAHHMDKLHSMDITFEDVLSKNMTYYVKRTGKRYRKNRRGYR
jgi:hypothetical protein